MENDLEIFVITNGRSTLKYVLESIELQSCRRRLTIIKNMLWVDALFACCETSQSEYYLRVDDDMFLHPFTVEYYLYKLHDANQCGVYECKLWEDWSNKPAGSLKAYRKSLAKQIGFRPNHLGKVDKNFANDIKNTVYKRIKDNSMIGLHACSTKEDQDKYRSLWRDNNSRLSIEEFSKTFDNIIHDYPVSLQDQYDRLKDLYKLNKRYKTGFFKFLRSKK